MDIDTLTLGQIKELTKAIGIKADVKGKDMYFPYTVGTNIFIRTVTLYYTGKISRIVDQWVTLIDAAWIADTGRFYDFLKGGECNEYECFQKEVNIPINSIIDVTVWEHDLFKGQK